MVKPKGMTPDSSSEHDIYVERKRPLPTPFVVLMILTILANIGSTVLFFLNLASVDRGLVMPTLRFMVIVVGSVLFLIGLARWIRWRTDR